jgi:hypothetical protein
MPKGKKPKNEGGNVVEMEHDTPDATEAEPLSETQAEPPEAEEPPPPVTVDPERGKRRALSLFDRVKQIPKADWGTRAFIYVYCLEPICDLKMGGEKKYLVKSKAPIYDEDSIMMDYGSGKYRLQLVYRKPAADKSDQMDACEIEIYNPKYPPKIPRSVWMNDPRNERWAALLQKEEPPQANTGLGTVTEAFNTFQNIRKNMAEELKPATPASSQDPLDMAQKILNIQNGASNPMVQLFQTQLQMFEKQAEEGRKRESELQKELREQLRAQATPAEKSDPIDTLVKAADKLQPLIDKFMNKGGEVAEKVVNGRRPKWWETMLENATPGFVEILKPFGAALAAKMMTPAQAQANGYANVGPQPAAPQPGVPQIAGPVQTSPVQPKLIQFLSQPLVMSSFISHFTDFQKPDGGEAGFEFAYWIFKSGGEQPLIDARAMGSTQILTMFKGSPAWPSMQPHEAKLTQFLDQILSWKPEMQQPLPPPDDDDDEDESEDLTGGSL